MRIRDLSKNTGFTLIELVVTIAILVILAGFVAPVATDMINQSRANKVIELADTLKAACQRYWTDTGTLAIEYGLYGNGASDPGPSAHQLSATTATATGWKGPYIDHTLTAKEVGTEDVIIVDNRFTLPAYQFDGFDLKGTGKLISGDGNLLFFKTMSKTVAQAIDEKMDGPSVPGDWMATGRVVFKETGSSGYGWLFIYLIKGD